MSELDYVDFLVTGELEVTGRLIDASNATLFGKIALDGREMSVIYKPVSGERPLWDFEDGTLAKRERAAFLLSELAGFGVVPATVLREGPFGLGAVQRWIEIDEALDLISFGRSSHEKLRAMALFDAIVNNTDRKFGHILVTTGEEVFGCDHGVTFHTEDKLRTVIWQFAGTPLSESELLQLANLESALDDRNGELADLLTPEELIATKRRISTLLEESAFPYPSAEWPAVPWPPV